MTGTAYQQPEDRSMTEQGAFITLARYRAKQRIKEDWLAPGKKLSEITAADVVWWAEAWLGAHPEMLDEAREMIRQSPRLQRLCKNQSKRCGAATFAVRISCSKRRFAHGSAFTRRASAGIPPV
jgi:hypothetical protein